MKSDNRDPLAFSVNDMLEPAEAPDVLADDDLDLPEMELVEAEPVGPLMPAPPIVETASEAPRALPAPA